MKKHTPALLIVDTFEGNDREPVVRHVFRGATRAEATAILKAHMKTDKFLRGCSKGRFGAIRCRNVTKWK